MAVKRRTIWVDDVLWAEMQSAAQAQGTNVSQLLQLLRWEGKEDIAASLKPVIDRPATDKAPLVMTKPQVTTENFWSPPVFRPVPKTSTAKSPRQKK